MRLLVTAGPTREFIDPFRYISNPSSGRMGYALAEAARRRGHRVVLVSGPVSLPRPSGVKLVKIVSAREMARRVKELFPKSDALIMAAAVSDYRPARCRFQKMKKKTDKVALKLVRNPDILSEIRASKGDRSVVGFSAETENLVGNARRKMRTKKMDLVLANDISLPESGFGSRRTRLVAIYPEGKVERWPLLTKLRAAERIISRVEKMAGRK